jgi:hypothetical protein
MMKIHYHKNLSCIVAVTAGKKMISLIWPLFLLIPTCLYAEAYFYATQSGEIYENYYSKRVVKEFKTGDIFISAYAREPEGSILIYSANGGKLGYANGSCGFIFASSHSPDSQEFMEYVAYLKKGGKLSDADYLKNKRLHKELGDYYFVACRDTDIYKSYFGDEKVARKCNWGEQLEAAPFLEGHGRLLVYYFNTGNYYFGYVDVHSGIWVSSARVPSNKNVRAILDSCQQEEKEGTKTYKFYGYVKQDCELRTFLDSQIYEHHLKGGECLRFDGYYAHVYRDGKDIGSIHDYFIRQRADESKITIAESCEEARILANWADKEEQEQKQRQERTDRDRMERDKNQSIEKNEWKLYKKTPEAIHYYKISKRDKSVVHLTIKIVLRDGEGHTVSNEAIDCEKDLRRGSQYWEYDSKGKLIKAQDFSQKWYPLDNLTILYNLKPLVCSDMTGIPSFTIAAKYKGLGTTYAILLSGNANREKVKNLVLGFRKARNEGSLSTMIPPTTPGSKVGGDYNAVEIVVFTEKEWATESRFKKWMESSQLKAEDKGFDKEYVKHIKGYYLYSFPSHEEGSIGYSGEGVKAPDYEKLF